MDKDKLVDEVGRKIVRDWMDVGMVGVTTQTIEGDTLAQRELDKAIVHGLKRLSKNGVAEPLSVLVHWFGGMWEKERDLEDRRWWSVVYVRVLDNAISLDIYKRCRLKIESGVSKDTPIGQRQEDGQVFGRSIYQDQNNIQTVGDELKHHRTKLMQRGLIQRKARA